MKNEKEMKNDDRKKEERKETNEVNSVRFEVIHGYLVYRVQKLTGGLFFDCEWYLRRPGGGGRVGSLPLKPRTWLSSWAADSA